MSVPACRSFLLLLAAVALPALAPPAVGQDRPIPWGHGTHALRVILKDLRFQPLQGAEQCLEHPDSTLIIALGETWPLDRFPGGIRPFVEKGGALLIATDRERPITRLLTPGCWEQDFSVMVREPAVRIRDDNLANRYRNSAECPIVWPQDNDSPLLRGVRLGVATNRPGHLGVWPSPTGARLLTMGRYPQGCAPSNVEFPQAEPPLFAVGGDWGKGRLLVLADHSVFINDMMLQQDNDNIGFAYNCLAWLRAGDVRRNQVLLYEEGTVNANFNVPLAPPLVPPPGPWINHLLQEMENENLFNRAVLGQVSVGQILRAVLAALTVGLLLYGLWRLLKARHGVETAALPLATAVQRLAPARAVLQQRHQDMLRRDNLWEAARALARECFEPLAGGVDLPPTKVRGAWRERRHLTKQVRRLWQLAFGEAPVRVTVPEFTRLVQEIDQVKAALACGTLHISSTPAGQAVLGGAVPSGTA